MGKPRGILSALGFHPFPQAVREKSPHSGRQRCRWALAPGVPPAFWGIRRQGMKPWPLANPPSIPPTPLGILILTTGKGKALARGGRGGKGRRLFPAGRPPQICPTSGSGSRPSALSQQACVCRLHGVPVCLEVTVHVSPNDCVYVCGCDLEGISVSVLGAVSVSLSVRPGSLPLLTAEHNPVEVLSHHLKVKTKGP